MKEYHTGLQGANAPDVLFSLSSVALSALNMVFVIALWAFGTKALLYTCSLSLVWPRWLSQTSHNLQRLDSFGSAIAAAPRKNWREWINF